MRIGIAVAEALQTTHDIGLIHRDVTPANILHGPDGPALTDFDIAEAPAELAGTVALDRLTPPNASPESLLREPQDARSDVYGLASTLWTLLAGHPPFAVAGDTSPDPFDYRERVLHDAAPPPVPAPDVPIWLQATLRRAMARAPKERYASAADLAAALQTASEQWPDGVPAPDHAAEPTPPVAPLNVAPSAATPSDLGPPVDRLVPVDQREPFDKPEPFDAPVVDLNDGWWSREEALPTTPPDSEAPDDAYKSVRPYRPRRSRPGLRKVGIAVVVFAVVGVAAFFIVRGSAPRSGVPQPAPPRESRRRPMPRRGMSR